jgi:DNA polymerase-3 subunit epsilon
MLWSRKRGRTAVDERAPVSAVRFVAVDTELTGLDERKDSIVSIGAVRMTGGTIHLGGTFYRLVNPATALTRESVVVHEITPSEVREQPGIENALRELVAYCGADVLVGHFVSIDLGFLNREAKRILGGPLPNAVIDTFSVYEWLRKRRQAPWCQSTAVRGYQLSEIARCFGVTVDGAHHALQDALATAELLQRFLPLLAAAGARDLGDLLAIGRPFVGGDRFRQEGEISNF